MRNLARRSEHLKMMKAAGCIECVKGAIALPGVGDEAKRWGQELLQKLEARAPAKAAKAAKLESESDGNHSDDHNSVIANSEYDPSDDDDQLCQICRKGCDEDKTILCDTCDKGYHSYCLTPKLKHVPEAEWHCPTCSR
jgi:hypothetical protein